MGMRFEENEDDAIVAEINITPLTDVFLVLLIIFMISSSAMLEGGLNVKLPSAKSTSLTSATGKPVYVSVAKDGGVSVNETITNEDSLVDTLKAALDASEKRVVVIRGDESIFLGNAVKIMEAAREAGAEKIAIATQPPGQ